MKVFYPLGRTLPTRLLLSQLLLFTHSFLYAQINAFNPARFGVDGDIAAEERVNGSFTPAGSHDWFPGTATDGYYVFDKEGSESLKTILAAGTNYSFTRKMPHRPYSVHDGVLLLAGTYARDFFGMALLPGRSEQTMFMASAPTNKSFASPGSWVTEPAGNTLPGKTDIIDAYIHMRRNGTSIVSGKPSNLLIYLAASTLNTDGDHYLDFELYKSSLDYNSTTGLFTSSGPALTGGRNIWEFNPDGSVKTYGEMTLSFTFNSSAVSDIAIYIWVPYSTQAGVDPKDFDFEKDARKDPWWGELRSGGYGYARIKPNEGAALQAWGTVNTKSTPAPAWGTSDRKEGASALNYYSTSYSTGQLAEAAIDLSSLGIDPAFATGTEKCRSPYLKVLVKSKSSSSVSATLQDFIAPFELFEEPVVPATIAAPGLITCAQPTQILAPQEIIEGAVYKWTTTNGEILSGANSAQAVIAKGGEYTLSAALYEGCTETSARVVVPEDLYRPVASAGFEGMLTSDPYSYVTLKGGDAEKSNYETPYGPSAGLQWTWTGPNNYTASEQNPRTTREGEYQLTVTELRNGCTDTASVIVEEVELIVLPLTLLHFSGKQEGQTVQLSWTVEENEEARWFEVQRATGGSHFTTLALVLATGKAGRQTYSFRDHFAPDAATYRLKAVGKEQEVQYSHLVSLRSGVLKEEASVRILQNPVKSDLAMTYRAKEAGLVSVRLYTEGGQLVYHRQQGCGAGINSLVIPGSFLGVKGHYVVEVVNAFQEVGRAQVIKL